MYTPVQINNISSCQPHPWHPSVVFIPEGWNGHKYWMAQTPFPPHEILPYRDYYELPCIHYSDDGIKWEAIDNNPIDKLDHAAIQSHNYYSDPHLILKNSILECYYRFSLLTDQQLVGNKTLLIKRTSKDGIHWSEREVIADLREKEDIMIWGDQIISQALVWDGQSYHCWYVDKSSYLNDRGIRMCSSSDGVNWTTNKKCYIEGNKVDPWHIDVQFYLGKYQMIVYDMWGLWWFESEDGIHFRFLSKILQPTQYFMDFYSEGLYRACSVLTDQNIKIYFSAKNANKTSIGLLTSKDRIVFKKCNGISQSQYLINYILPQLTIRNCKRFVKHLIKKVRK